MVFVVMKRLCQSPAPDLGSSVFIMAPQHHMEVHKGRDVCFCFATLALGFTVQVCFGLQNCRGHAVAGCQEGYSHHLKRVRLCSLLSLFMWAQWLFDFLMELIIALTGSPKQRFFFG